MLPTVAFHVFLLSGKCAAQHCEKDFHRLYDELDLQDCQTELYSLFSMAQGPLLPLSDLRPALCGTLRWLKPFWSDLSHQMVSAFLNMNNCLANRCIGKVELSSYIDVANGTRLKFIIHPPQSRCGEAIRYC